MVSPTPDDVVRAALSQPLPSDGTHGWVGPRAALVVAALIEHGHLPDPADHQEPPIEQLARFLADQSNHPRYTHADGWRRLLESDRDVDVAYTTAARGRPQEEIANLSAIRTRLTAHVRASQ